MDQESIKWLIGIFITGFIVLGGTIRVLWSVSRKEADLRYEGIEDLLQECDDDRKVLHKKINELVEANADLRVKVGELTALTSYLEGQFEELSEGK